MGGAREQDGSSRVVEVEGQWEGRDGGVDGTDLMIGGVGGD